MDLYKTYAILIFFLSFSQIGICQEKGYEPIKKDSTYTPYVSYDKESGNYIIRYMKSAETDKVYETLFIPTSKVTPQFNVVIKKEGGNYGYYYTLLNTGKGQQDISSFEIEIRGLYEKIYISSPWQFSDMNDVPFVQFSHKVLEIPDYDPDEPIQFKSDLQKGEKLSFKIESKYLPSIVTSYIAGQRQNMDLSFIVPPSYKVRKMIDSLRRKENYNRGLKVKTIGPQKVSDNITPIEIADTLTSYLSFSCDTSWITNQGICRSLKTKINNIQKEVERGKDKNAVNNIKALLKELNALNEKKISSEAYALLYFNGEYLLKILTK